MLHGTRARFFPGTIVCLSEVQHKEYTDELGELLRYDGGKSKWLVRLHHPRFDGRQIFVSETGFNMVYCVLPANAATSAVRPLYGKRVSAQLRSGLGQSLVSLDGCQAGQVIFEELPFVITASGVEAMWLARWHAYVRLYDEADTDEIVRVALAAFDALSCGGHGEASWHVREAADFVAHTGGYREALGDTEFLEVVERIRQVLLKVKANQFEFNDGAREASAIYRQAALMNHSCSPTVLLEPQWSDLSPGLQNERDGVLSVRAARGLEAGEELCHNYGPDELLSWPLARRQDYILTELGFCCRCSRCQAETGKDEVDAGDLQEVIADLSSMD